VLEINTNPNVTVHTDSYAFLNVFASNHVIISFIITVTFSNAKLRIIFGKYEEIAEKVTKKRFILGDLKKKE